MQDKALANRGHALRYTKGDDNKNIEPKPVLPTPQDVAIIRRASAGYIVVTMQDGSPTYSYEDGSRVTLRSSKVGTSYDDGERHFNKMVAEGWLIPDKGDALFPDDPQPQIYQARKPQ
jgi:hypothetical protein